MATTDLDTNADEVGTIDSVLIAFPSMQLDGKLVPPLLDLVDRRLIRVLDALIILKAEDGTVQSLTSEDLDPEQVGELGELAGVSSGLLDDTDAVEAASVLDPGSAALLLVYENLWSIPFAVAVRQAGGQLVASSRIPVQALLARLDALEA